MRRARTLHCALAVVLVVVLAGCGGDDTPIRTVTPQITASSPSPDLEAVTKKDPGCRLLTPKERASIAGQRLDAVFPSPKVEGTLFCRWVPTLKKPVTTSIQVTSQKLQSWVRNIPAHIERLMATGQSFDEHSKQLQEMKTEIARAPEKISDEQACRYFRTLAKMGRGKAKAVGPKNEGILFQGTQDGDFKVSWQRCGEGVHTEIVYDEPDLQVSLALGQAVIRLGKLAHKRGARILASE